MPITNVKVKLLGESDNAFAILAKVRRALKKAGYDERFIKAYVAKATAGDYDHLLRVTMEYVEVQ